MNDKRIKLMSEAPVAQAIMKMSIPMVMGMMVQVFYNLVDTFFVGRLGDANQLAAANMGMPIFMMLMALASIVGTGAASYISRSLGDKNYDEANHTASIAVGLLVGLSLIITIGGVVFLEPITRVLGASADTFEFTKQYVGITLIGSTAIVCNYAFGQLLRAEGDAMKSMMGMLIGTVVNVILDPIFIFVFDMGVGGAALATVIGNLLGLGYYIYHFVKGTTLLRIQPRKIDFNGKIYGEITKIGVPASLNQALMSVAMMTANNLGMVYGEKTVAGMGVATRIIMIGTFIFIGFAAGCQPLVGFNYGAKNKARVKEIIQKGMMLTSTIGIVLAILFALFAKVLIGAFTPDQEVIEIGATIIRALIFSLPFVGIQMVTTTSIQAMGKGFAGLILSVSRQGILYIPLLYILNAVAGFNGFIYAQPITDIIMATFAMLMVFRILRQEDVVEEKLVSEIS